MPDTLPPVETTAEVARRNVALAWMMVGLAVLLIIGSLLVALIYLHYD